MVVKALPKKMQPEEIRKVTRPARKAIRKGFSLLSKTERVKRISKECGSRAMWDIDYAGKCMEKLQNEFNAKRDGYLGEIAQKLSEGWTKTTISIKPDVYIIVNLREDSMGEAWIYFDPMEDLFPWEIQLVKTDIFNVEETLKKTMETYEKTIKKEAKLRKWASTIISVIISLIPGVGWIISIVLNVIQAVYEYRIKSTANKDMKRALEIQKDEEIARLKALEEKIKGGAATIEEKKELINTTKELVKDKQQMEGSWLGKAAVVAGAAAMIL